ncbi:hypothetical protein TNCT_94421 [Trichonephila clavata]|uniref:Uncharacterized protein n=1 Tax=Trichonephila clavata TaxID=2740835 RepID=A0A8X6GJL2_TRICU|nr:hypothetical protein TNCT_94421 [Trichonephila clavata]
MQKLPVANRPPSNGETISCQQTTAKCRSCQLPTDRHRGYKLRVAHRPSPRKLPVATDRQRIEAASCPQTVTEDRSCQLPTDRHRG